MRDYIPKEWQEARWIYQEVLSTIRGYEHMCRQMRETELDVIFSTPLYRRGGVNDISRPTESKAILIAKRNAEYERKTKAVEQALIFLEPDERKIIMGNIVHNAPLRRKGVTVRDRTIERRKHDFIYIVAHNLSLI